MWAGATGIRWAVSGLEKQVYPGRLICLIVVRCQGTTSDIAQREPHSRNALTGDASLPPSSYKNRKIPTPRECDSCDCSCLPRQSVQRTASEKMRRSQCEIERLEESLRRLDDRITRSNLHIHDRNIPRPFVAKTCRPYPSSRTGNPTVRKRASIALSMCRRNSSRKGLRLSS